MDFMKGLFAAMQEQRTSYHLTLGQLIDELERVPPDLPVMYDIGGSPGQSASYRGYYEDMAFDRLTTPVTAGQLLKECRSALTETFTGYKGGDYRMTARTPLWQAEWGNLGRAITRILRDSDRLVLMTREVW